MRRVVLSGASGLLGRALAAALRADGAELITLVRRAPQHGGELRWDPDVGEIDLAGLEGATDFVHLSGEAVAERRWSDERKRVILDSRTRSTATLVRAIEKLRVRPKSFVQASAIGYYGLHADAPVAEDGPQGDGFLAEVCRAWEDAGRPVEALGVRWVAMRIGVVFSPDGGALAKLLPVFKMGGGGPIGDGKQVMSWISLDDVVRAFVFALERESLSGPVNVVAPEPVDNSTLARELGKALSRPAIMRVPRMAISAVFGEMGRETVLSSQRVRPAKLQGAGFVFSHPRLPEALAALLSR